MAYAWDKVNQIVKSECSYIMIDVLIVYKDVNNVIHLVLAKNVKWVYRF